MSFDKKMYTCKICGRIDFSAERFVHICPEPIEEKNEEKEKDVDDSSESVKKILK